MYSTENGLNNERRKTGEVKREERKGRSQERRGVKSFFFFFWKIISEEIWPFVSPKSIQPQKEITF